MNLKIILFFVIVIGVMVILGNYSPVATMTGSAQSLYTSMTTALLAGEINEIRDIVNEVLILREIRFTDEAETLAIELDQRINNLDLVKMHCEEEISTLDLVYEKDPYKKLQEICPPLNSLSLSKAAELFRLI